MRPRGFTLVELLVVTVIIAALAGLSTPVIMQQKKKAALAAATSNAKQIGYGLFEFDAQFGALPDNHTAEAVAALAGSGHNLSGNQSNDYFRQLLVAGIGTEEIFFAKTPYTRQPDNASSGGKALAAGEVGFGYIMRDATTGLSSSGNPAQTVVAAPLLDARNDWSFDPGPYGDKAVVLRLDQSVQQVPIRQTDQRAIVGGGWPLEQTGEDTAWGDRIQPVLKAPGKLGN